MMQLLREKTDNERAMTEITAVHGLPGDPAGADDQRSDSQAQLAEEQTVPDRRKQLGREDYNYEWMRDGHAIARRWPTTSGRWGNRWPMPPAQ